MKCAWHLCDNKLKGKQRKFCSTECADKGKVTDWRQRVKQRAVDYLGGKCKLCGYNKCIAALEFHHKDPTQKDFGISANGTTRSWEKMRLELDKCVLVCSNCHREIHAGLIS